MVKIKRFLVLLLFCSFCVLAEDSYLEVNGVTTRATGSNSLVAKQKALSNSTNRAFNQMLDSYFPEAVSLKNRIRERKIQNCVYDYSVDQEKFSGKTYIAKFSFRFSKEAVQKILREYKIAGHEEKKSKKTTVAIYTRDYLNNYGRLRDCKVVLFSPKRMILEIPANELSSLTDYNIAFEKTNAEIRP